MDALTAFGAVAVTAMLVCYALEERAVGYVFAFAGACLASSLYGFLQGAWPFGVVELVWAGVAPPRSWRQDVSTPSRYRARSDPGNGSVRCIAEIPGR
jgi:hypothetical protein